MKKPLYRQVISDLEERITHLKSNDRLPSERQLLIQYNVSRNTIRLALQDLEERGLIYRLHGKGTFVSSRYLDQPNIGKMYSFSEEVRRSGQKPTTLNQSLELVEPSQKIAEQLNLHDAEKAYELIRLRLANDQPYIYSKTYLPEKLFPSLTLDMLQDVPLYDVLKDKYKQLGVMAFEDVQAVNLNKQESKYLQEEEGSASLKIYRKTINEKNVPIEFTISVVRGDKFIYRSKQYNQLL